MVKTTNSIFGRIGDERMKYQTLRRMIGIVLVMVFVIVTFLPVSLSAAVQDVGSAANHLLENGLTRNVEDGTILHTWCWSYKTVEENIPEIAASGFSAIQVSPISLCKVGGNRLNGGWYWHYQPVNYEVFGNYQMGTLEDFQKMCQVAHEYGLKVIVDTVINHCTSDYSAIDESITGGFEGQAFHDHSSHNHPSGNWSETDRYEETQYPLSGLYDWNTQREDVQEYLKTFLEKCVEYGADGFRYDAAKLIELPDDQSVTYGNDFASDFWPNILQNGASFQYGEVLQEGGKHEYDVGEDSRSGYDDRDSSRLGAYHSLSFTNPDGSLQPFYTTASYYGFRVRDCISNQNLSVERVGDFLMPEGASSRQIVTWVESHDNYCNNASYLELDDQQVIQAWAIVAARAGGTPLFFSRPNGSSAVNPWGDDILGAVGSNLFKNPQVVAVNYFANEMGDDLPEFLSNPMGDSRLLMIERGTSDFAGAVIINTSEEEVVLSNVPVSAMADGTYYDSAYGGVFQVKDNKLSGTVGAGKVAVVYNSQVNAGKKVAFRPGVDLSLESQDFLTDSIHVTINARGCDRVQYRIDTGDWIPCQNGTTLLIGAQMQQDESATLKVVGLDASGAVLAEMQATYTKRVAHGQTIAYFDSRAYEEWNDVFVYVYSNSGNNGGWPGVKPEDLGNGLYRYVLPYALESAAGLHVMWTNNGTKTDGQAELPISSKTQMVYKADRSWVKYDGSLACVGVSVPGGNVTENFVVNIIAVDCEQVTYSINGAEQMSCGHGTQIPIDVDALAVKDSISLEVRGKDATGKEYSAKAVYTKAPDYGETIVYLDSGLYPQWTKPYAYFWASGVAEYAPWPGVEMADEGEGVYSCVLPDALAGCTMNVIFSDNGANQHSDVVSKPGTKMILTASGEWIAYVEEDPDQMPDTDEITQPTSENTQSSEETKDTVADESTQQQESSPQKDDSGRGWIIWVTLIAAGAAIVGVILYLKLRES